MSNKLFDKIKVLKPVNLIFITIIAFILLYIFLFVDTVNTLYINTTTPVSRFIQKYAPIRSDFERMPLASNHPNVISSGIFYNIAGEVEEITPETIKIRSHDGPLPVFKISSATPLFKMVEVGKPPEVVKISEVKLGVTLVVSATYDFVVDDWRVNRLTIDNNLKPRIPN